MANWYGTARSNYFRVKDETAFRNMAKDVGLQIFNGKEESSGLFAVSPADNSDDGAWPSARYNQRTHDWDEIDIVDAIASHLADGEVAVLQETGAEKLRYVTGRSVAFNNTGETVVVDIDDIYQKAKDHFHTEEITEAMY